MADKYLGAINAGLVTNDGRAADTSPLYDLGIPSMANLIEDSEDG